MTAFTKPFLSTEDQISLLKVRGMVIADEPKAKMCIERIGYYRLSAYWYPFRKKISTHPAPVVRGDDFVAGTTFEDIFNFYVFDKKLRLLTMDALERIEIALRAKILNHLGARDPFAHRKLDFLDGKFSPKHRLWLKRQDQSFARSKEDFAKHFRNKYPISVPPIWISAEVWDWGMLSHFFSGIKPADKDSIASTFGSVNGREFETWVRAMNDVRNICAHHSRLWNRGLTVIPRLPDGGRVPDLNHIPRDNQFLSRIYVVLAIMRLLLKRIHPNNSSWHIRIADYVKSTPLHPRISTNIAGFPANWESQAIWL